MTCFPFQDLSYESPEDLFQTIPSYTTFVGDFGMENVFLLEEQDLYFENIETTSSNSLSLYSQTVSSPTSSQCSSSYGEDVCIMSNEQSFTSKLTFNMKNVQTGVDVYMDDNRNVPESNHLVQETGNFNKSSVIVKNVFTAVPCDHIPVKKITMAETPNLINDTNNAESKEDFDKEMKTNVDIDAFVEECFAVDI